MNELGRKIRRAALAGWAVLVGCALIGSAHAAKFDFIDVPSVFAGEEFELSLTVSHLGDVPPKWKSLQIEFAFDTSLLQFLGMAFDPGIPSNAFPTLGVNDSNPGVVLADLVIGDSDHALLSNEKGIAVAKFRILDGVAASTTSVDLNSAVFGYLAAGQTFSSEDVIDFSDLSPGLVTISAIPEPRLVVTMLAGLLLIGLRFGTLRARALRGTQAIT